MKFLPTFVLTVTLFTFGTISASALSLAWCNKDKHFGYWFICCQDKTAQKDPYWTIQNGFRKSCGEGKPLKTCKKSSYAIDFFSPMGFDNMAQYCKVAYNGGSPHFQ